MIFRQRRLSKHTTAVCLAQAFDVDMRTVTIIIAYLIAVSEVQDAAEAKANQEAFLRVADTVGKCDYVGNGRRAVNRELLVCACF